MLWLRSPKSRKSTFFWRLASKVDAVEKGQNIVSCSCPPPHILQIVSSYSHVDFSGLLKKFKIKWSNEGRVRGSPLPLLPPHKAEVGRAWQLVAAAEINKHQGSWMDRVQKRLRWGCVAMRACCWKRPWGRSCRWIPVQAVKGRWGLIGTSLIVLLSYCFFCLGGVVF